MLACEELQIELHQVRAKIRAGQTPIVVAVLGFLLSRRLVAAQHTRETQDRERRARQDTEAKLREDEILRRKYPHIELTLECEFFGESQGWRLATFSVVANNVGQVRQDFSHVYLRLRGLNGDAAFDLLGNTHRVAFPEELLKTTDLKPPEWNYVFIEPGVKQRIPLTTRIPAGCAYVRAHVEVKYDEYSPHTAEAVFAVPHTAA